jgi:holo-[acyl-carrier protein] synthase
MIRGVGIDLVEIERLQHALERHGDRFARRILAEQEWSEFSELKPTLQARFLARSVFKGAWYGAGSWIWVSRYQLGSR